MIDPEEPGRETSPRPKPISDTVLERALEAFGAWEMTKVPAQPPRERCDGEARQHRPRRAGEAGR